MKKAKVLLQPWRYIAAVGGLAILYFLVATGVAAIPLTQPFSPPVWIPLGINLAAVVLFGAAVAPGLWLGEFWFALSLQVPWFAACGTATAVTLQALIAAKLLKRFPYGDPQAQFRSNLARLRDVAALVLLAAVLSTPIHSVLRLASLCWGGVIPWNQFWLWIGQVWLGDILAVLLVTPVILTWFSPKPADHWQLLPSGRRRWFEIGLWLVLLLSLSWLELTVGTRVEFAYPLEYGLFPLVIWAALRFGQRGTTLASLVISGIALWGLSQGGSPFVLDAGDFDRGTLLLQTFMGVVSVTGLFLAASVAERHQAIGALGEANEQLRELAHTLDQQVHQRTQQLRDSETRARRLMDSNIIGIVFWNESGDILEANQAFYGLLGYQPHEAAGLNWRSITPPQGQPLDQQMLAAVQQSALHRPFETEFLHKARRRVPVLVGATAIEGSGIGVGFVLDLTDRNRAQAALQESERRFRRLAESNIFGVAFGDFNGHVHYINDYLLNMLGCEREELLSGQLCWADMTPLEFLPVDIRGGEELKQRGVCTPYEKEFVRQDGRRVPVLIGAALLQEPYNTQQEIMAFCVDLTQLKQTEAALRQSQAEVAALNQDLQHRVDELQTLFEVIPIGIAIAADAECRQIKVNRAFAQILGIPHAQAGSTAAVDSPSPAFRVMQNGRELAGDELPLQYAAAQRQEVSGVEVDVVRADGQVFNLFGYASPLLDEHGTSRGAVSAFLDITERKRAEAKYAQLLLLEQSARAEAEAAQRRLATIFETSPVGLGFLDRSQRFVAINEALADINGLSPQQHLGHTIAELFGESDPTIVSVFERLYATGKPFIAPNFAMNVPGRADRRPGYYNVYYLPDITPSGEVESVLVYVLDVTDRVRLEQRELFLANASTVLTSSLDYEATLERLANLAVPELADWCMVDTIEEDGAIRRLAIAHADPAQVKWAWELEQRYPLTQSHPQGVPQVLRTGQAEIYTEFPDALLETIAQDAEHLEILRQMNFSSAMILPLTVGGQPLGAISLIAAAERRYGSADLALAEELARRAAQAMDNARLYRQAQDLNRVKDEFLAILSHELRSPLNGILGWAQLMRRGKLNEATISRAIETIERNARAQVQLIDDLLDISRIIRGKLRLEVRPIELAPVIEAAIDAMRPAAAAKEIELQSILEPTVPLVSGDPERLQQILWNLLSNAIKFTQKGGWVQVWLRHNQSNVEIVVSDNGKGIRSDFLPFVFERFRQADSSLTRTYGGLGLGLAIVRHLVELHGGTVQVASPGEGQGSTFTVRLPLVTTYSEASSVSHAPTAAPEDTWLDNSPRLDGLHVLVVDDEADARELVATVLQEAGATVIAVSSATSALTALPTVQPHVLISDIGMPDEDGYTLIRKVRGLSEEQGGRVPAVALTAYAREEDRRRALMMGFQTHVSKPVNPSDLVVVVASLVGRTGVKEG
jgi:PAS domain S-box-containing protein